MSNMPGILVFLPSSRFSNLPELLTNEPAILEALASTSLTFTLYATKIVRAPITTAPNFSTSSFHSLGPKSGRWGPPLSNRALSPSY